MPTQAKPLEVLIAGGAISGLFCAYALAYSSANSPSHIPLKITVLESSSTLQTIGGSLLVPPNAARVLHHYDIWEEFKKVGDLPPSYTTFRYSDGKVLEETEHRGVEEKFGFPVMSVTRKAYQKLLYDAAINAGVTVRFGCRVADIDEKTPSITLLTGEMIKADLIIGADGIGSRTRTSILSPNPQDPIPESIAYQVTIPGTLMRSDALTSPLMAPNSPLHSWYGPHRQIVAGAKSSGDFYSVTLIVSSSVFEDQTVAAGAKILVPNSPSSYTRADPGPLRLVAEVFEKRVRRFVEMVRKEDCFLWKIAYLPKLENWTSSSGKVVLIGDAAHAMVPHLGMGAAASIEDAGVLAQCISLCPSPTHIPLALQTYTTLRKPRSERIAKAALAAGIVKALPDGPEQEKRDKKMVERMDPSNPKFEFWRSAGNMEWLYGYDFEAEAKRGMTEALGGAGKGTEEGRSRL